MVRKEEWDILKERDRILSENARILTAENQDLRNNITDVQAEAHRLEHIIIPDLQCQITTLQTDNAGLRRSLDNATEHAEKHHREVERLEKENKNLREENVDLRSRIRSLNKQLDGSASRRVSELLREVDFLKGEIRHWKCKFEDIDRLYCEIRDKLESRTQRLEAYEEILKRRRII